ncbi:sulfotransferase domain-containing protein [Sporohalobacter salinus]|uniref:sulfotransferase domain-containing protein n=1 Tax=Sporohalobacter salinus TaxID=1494606 RepID=UPI0019601DA5|nr:sulfotransferase domain-containing protein [Sporohalobacter salinus]MBM7622979.1 hypothetical protein [Sporohalobacter salinus]
MNKKNIKQPHLMVIGAQKAATTWLQHVLDYNDQFWLPSDFQEVHFFDRHYDRGIDYYLNLYKNAPDDKITCDVTPDYLDHPLVPDRILETSFFLDRSVKFILICREPVARYFSAFQMSLRQGESWDLSEAIIDSSDLFNKGLYYKHMKNYFKYFKRDDFLLLLFDNIKDNKELIFKRISTFLNMENNIVDPYKGKRVNAGGMRKIRFLSQVWKAGGKILRFLGWTSLLHNIKSSNIIQRLYKMNSSNYNISQEEKNALKNLKKDYKKDVLLFSRLIDNSDLIKRWGYDE